MEHHDKLGPSVIRLRSELETFNSRLGAQTRIDEIQALNECDRLIDKCIEKLREWRHVNNYPSFRAHPDDANVLDELQYLFATADKCIKTFEGKLIVIANKNFNLDEKLMEATQLRQKLVSKSFVMEHNPRQAIIIRKKEKQKSGDDAEGDYDDRNEDDQDDYEEPEKPKRRKTDGKTKEDERRVDINIIIRWEESGNPKRKKRGKPQKKPKRLEMVIRCLLPSHGKKMAPEITIHNDFKILDYEESQPKEAKVEITNPGTVEGCLDSEGSKKKDDSVNIKCCITDVKNLGIHQPIMYLLRVKFRSASYSAVVETLPIGFGCKSTQMTIPCCYLLWYNAVSETHDPCLTQRNFPPSTKLEYLVKVLNSEFHKHTSFLATWVPLSANKKMPANTRDITFSDHSKEFLCDMLGAKKERRDSPSPSGVTKASHHRGDENISFAAFGKHRSHGSRAENFTFWAWFYACYHTMRTYFPKLYADGLVVGFMSFDQAQKTLVETKSRLEESGRKILLLRFTNRKVIAHKLLRPTLITADGDCIRYRALKPSESELVKVLKEKAMPLQDEQYAENLLVLKINGECVPFPEAFRGFEHFSDDSDSDDYTTPVKELVKLVKALSVRSEDDNNNDNHADQQMPTLPHVGSFLNNVDDVVWSMDSAESDLLLTDALFDARNTMEEAEEEALGAQGGWAYNCE